MRRAIFAALVAALLLPSVASAAKKAPQLKVMTRNLYLGADLGPAIAAKSTCEAIDAGGKILNDVDASDFTKRAPLLAAEINRNKPDLVGLQEAALWREQEDADFTATPATKVRYDFLATLLNELGGKYAMAVVQDEFDQELPANTDGDASTADAGFPLCGADKDGRLTMRDAILIRKGSKVQISGARQGHFKNHYSVTLGGVVPVDVDRGWVSVEGRLGKKRFRFVDSHLESFDQGGTIRAAQAKELVASGGPYRTKKQLVAVGDYNSGSAKDRIGPGLTKPGDELAYKALVGFGLTNLGTRQTCCFNDVFAVPAAGVLDHTVDHVFVKPKLKQVSARVTTSRRNGLISSDHGGLVSTLKLK